MLTDIEIAQQANILPIREIASKLGLTEDDYEPYGKYKAKLTEEPATNALWFKNPGTNVDCPETFYGRLSGKYKKHCFYNPGLKDNCDL